MTSDTVVEIEASVDRQKKSGGVIGHGEVPKSEKMRTVAPPHGTNGSAESMRVIKRTSGSSGERKEGRLDSGVEIKPTEGGVNYVP